MIFTKPPLNSLATVSDRWTPLYLEHGRLEVDDSSVKWISSTNNIFHLPVATISVLLLGPGTSVTHAAIKACGQSNTTLCWVGEDSMRYYASGVAPTATNTWTLKQIEAFVSRRTQIALRMFKSRFPDIDSEGSSIPQLMGMEGERVKRMYAIYGKEYGVKWKGRRFIPGSFNVSDEINKSLSMANQCLYAYCLSAIHSSGFLPSVGFIHHGSPLDFVFDISDLYKCETSVPAAFQAVATEGFELDMVLGILKMKIEEANLPRRIVKDMQELFA